MCHDTDSSELPATIPPPGPDPDKAWRVALMEEMAELKADVRALTKLVRELNATVQDCVNQVLSYAAETEKLRTRVEIAEARITLRPTDDE